MLHLLLFSIQENLKDFPPDIFWMVPPSGMMYRVARYNNTNVFSVLFNRDALENSMHVTFTKAPNSDDKYIWKIADTPVCFDHNLNAITCDNSEVKYGPDLKFTIEPESLNHKVCTNLQNNTDAESKKYCVSHTSIMNEPKTKGSFMDLALYDEIKDVHGQRWVFVPYNNSYDK